MNDWHDHHWCAAAASAAAQPAAAAVRRVQWMIGMIVAAALQLSCAAAASAAVQQCTAAAVRRVQWMIGMNVTDVLHLSELQCSSAQGAVYARITVTRPHCFVVSHPHCFVSSFKRNTLSLMAWAAASSRLVTRGGGVNMLRNGVALVCARGERQHAAISIKDRLHAYSSSSLLCVTHPHCFVSFILTALLSLILTALYHSSSLLRVIHPHWFVSFILTALCHSSSLLCVWSPEHSLLWSRQCTRSSSHACRSQCLQTTVHNSNYVACKSQCRACTIIALAAACLSFFRASQSLHPSLLSRKL